MSAFGFTLSLAARAQVPFLRVGDRDQAVDEAVERALGAGLGGRLHGRLDLGPECVTMIRNLTEQEGVGLEPGRVAEQGGLLAAELLEPLVVGEFGGLLFLGR